MYYLSYQNSLAILLGKERLNVVYSLILILSIALLIVIVLVLIAWLLFLLCSLLFDPIYCADLLEARDALLAKIAKVEAKIEHYQEDAKLMDDLFKEALRDNLPDDMKEERLKEKRASERNLNTERKVLRTLKERLDSGNYDSFLSTPSSLGKRNSE